MLTGPTLDVRMSARTTLERALEVADLASWPARQEAARAEGRCVGLGFATFIEAAPGPPDFQESIMPGGSGGLLAGEPARSVLETDGTVSVYTQQMPHGQGHETTLAQVAADELGVPIEQVRVRYGDTSITPFGLSGTGGSRSAPMAGGAVTYSARALREQVLDVAADLLEAPPRGPVVDDGDVHVAGVPSISVSFADVAAARPGEQLRSDFSFDGAEGGWAQATHVCWVEVDLETGRVHIDRYVAVEDCGELINPNVVDGQVSGGVVQGIGAVLYEKSFYDDQAQLPGRHVHGLPAPDRSGGARDRDPPRRDADRHRDQVPRRRRGRDDRRAGRAHQRDRGRARAPRRAHHRTAPPAHAHPRAGGRDHSRRVIPFVDWLAGQTRRRDAIGDLARDTRRDDTWPPSGKVNRIKLRAHLEAHDAIPGAVDALDAAWYEWDALRREERDG